MLGQKVNYVKSFPKTTPHYNSRSINKYISHSQEKQIFGKQLSFPSRKVSLGQHLFAAEIDLEKPSPISPRPLFAHGVIKENYTTLIEMWDLMLSKYRNMLAVIDDHHSPKASLTYGELFERIQNFAAALQMIGIRKGDKISIFGEHSANWMVADHASFMCGAADAVRSHTADFSELEYIFNKTQSRGLIVENAKALEKISPLFQKNTNGASMENGNGHFQQKVEFVIVLYGEIPEKFQNEQSTKIYTFDQMQQIGIEQINKGNFEVPDIKPSDTLTLVFTSGTTGKPKGAVLSHANLVYQTHAINPRIQLQPQQKIVSFLPIWHIYERAVCYLCLRNGLTLITSSKLTLVNDFKKHKPNYATCVPQVLDFMQKKVFNTIKKGSKLKQMLANFFFAVSTHYIQAKRIVNGLSLAHAVGQMFRIQLVAAFFVRYLLAPIHMLAEKLVYKKIRDTIGVQNAMVSGGGSLSQYLDNFYEIIGLCVINGWGLTETSPVIACRGVFPELCPRMTTGRPLEQTTVRIVDVDNPMQEVPDGQKGIILADGPGILKEYYQEPDETQKAFQYSPPGTRFFNTGDLGYLVPKTTQQKNIRGALVITGRVKDTIVLSNGENVEPAPIEDAIMQSQYVSQVLVIGQDMKQLGVLVYPNKDFLKDQGQDKLSKEDLQKLIFGEIKKATETRFLDHEQIRAVQVIDKQFSFEDGTMTQTLKPKKTAIYQQYAKDIQRLSDQLNQK